jgi:hypothetical protein
VRIKKFRKLEFLQQRETRSRPDLVITNKGHEEYEVHDILNDRRKNRKTEYLVRWKDYGPEDVGTKEKSTECTMDPTLVRVLRMSLRRGGVPCYEQCNRNRTDQGQEGQTHTR